MKEILDAIDNIKLECPGFSHVMIEVSSLSGGEMYVLRTDAYHPEHDRSFCIRVSFSKMKDALKALDECKLKTICAYNDLDFL
jgi:hypothetical protein